MATIAYHASHEQFPPSELLAYAKMAEQSGFEAVSSSDHFFPWSERQGQSGFSFSWLGAAMQATTVPYSVVCAPGQRYHPAIVGQAIATLSEMFPDRFCLYAGSGEAINELITGEKWPPKQERNVRLMECVQIIRELLQGKTVSHKGLVTVENAKLYTLPENPPPIFCAAVSPETAAWAGSWADGLITISKPYEELKALLNAFRQNGGNDKPVHLKVQLSYSSTEESALKGAYDQWRTNIFQGSVLGDMPTVAHFDAAAEFVKPEDMFSHVRISAEPAEHLEWIKKDIELGFEKIILHNVNREQRLFIEDFGREVLPMLK
ncbi:TIGR03885 family FMN-dependent LLM class oxidoreductase [Desertivirga brevis]|uniref:TIGR03885 family FMN-dependent LLM class oxidoreductase n=1 Tax=Desertivirga brevis TaxID=2810310 RepID=UPI001A976398|nr:TIGR03885 family FMN-dependent LLM class oxidoreductase [Pedobacter sp. SYSU D00873]